MLLMGIIPPLTRDIAFISQGRETKKPRSLAGLDSRFSEGSASIGAGAAGWISVVRGRLVRAIVCIVTDAIRIHVAHPQSQQSAYVMMRVSALLVQPLASVAVTEYRPGATPSMLPGWAKE